MPTAEERHERFNPGPPTRTRGWYGHFPVGVPRRRLALRRRIDAAWDSAIAENAQRTFDTTTPNPGQSPEKASD